MIQSRPPPPETDAKYKLCFATFQILPFSYHRHRFCLLMSHHILIKKTWLIVKGTWTWYLRLPYRKLCFACQPYCQESLKLASVWPHKNKVNPRFTDSVSDILVYAARRKTTDQAGVTQFFKQTASIRLRGLWSQTWVSVLEVWYEGSNLFANW